MPNNKITIGIGKQNKSDKNLTLPSEELINSPVTPVEAEQPSINGEIWGNDSLLEKQLPKEYLEEKRRYVRVRYIQRVECRVVFENRNPDPITLPKPVILTMSDVSMGGIGAVCDNELKPGSILEFEICFDNLNYTIQCEIIYCIQMDESFRLGLRFVRKDKDFVKHLKILVARISLKSTYERR